MAKLIGMPFLHHQIFSLNTSKMENIFFFLWGRGCGFQFLVMAGFVFVIDSTTILVD